MPYKLRTVPLDLKETNALHDGLVADKGYGRVALTLRPAEKTQLFLIRLLTSTAIHNMHRLTGDHSKNT